MSREEGLGHVAPNRTFLSILLGAAAGMSYALLIPIVLGVVRDERGGLEADTVEPFRIAAVEIAHPGLAAVFVASCLFILAARTTSQLLLNRAATDIAANLRVRLYDTLLDAPLTAIERIGTARLATALATDVPRMVLGARMLPELLVSGITIFGMLGFLLARNAGVFWFVLASVAFGALTYQIPMALGQRHYVRSRAAQDELNEAFAAIVHGFKELKLSPRQRAAHLADTVWRHDRAMTATEKAGSGATTLATNYGDLLGFFVIGFVLFVFVNYHAIADEDLIGVVMVLLYVASPVAVILRALPQVSISRLASRRYRELLDRLVPEPVDPVQRPASAWREVRLERVCYAYPPSEGGFCVGPLDLSFPRGAITFIVGGNGSGKSTLGKLLALHYPPTSGRILFGNQPIGPDCLTSYRETIAAIHSDYHLFSRPLGAAGGVWPARVRELLDELGLAHKVRFENGRFSTLALSDGQRRRLALLCALVEDRDLYLFDEWAADQDPEFKAIFYRRVLPDLRAAGKAVIAITHDDRYFDVADRLVFMENGRVRERIEGAGAQPAPAERVGPESI